MSYSSDEEPDQELLELLRAKLGIGSSNAKAPADTKVLQSAHFIVDHSIDVALHRDSIVAAAEHIHHAMSQRKYSTKTWKSNPLHPQERDEEAVKFVFTMDLLNFSFWSLRDEKDRYTVEYKGERYTGYWSLVAAIRRALEEGIPITCPYFWVDEQVCTVELLQHVFRSETDEEIPLFKARVACLREAGQILCESYDGSIINLIKQADKSAAELVLLLVETFPCFKDEATFEGKLVRFYKRAQIFVADLWACFDGEDIGEFTDINKITMFADYRVPVILHSMGCLLYSPRLESVIRHRELIDSGSAYEIQIRGCSIWAVEMIRRTIKERHPETDINAILIDFYLYDSAKEMEAATVEHGITNMANEVATLPHHRVRSIWY